MKRILLLLPLMLSASLSLAAADIKLNAEGKKLYKKLLHAADTNDCESVIITGFQFKQGYSTYLETHPVINDKTEFSIGQCVDALNAQDIPVKSPSSGIAE